MVRSSESYNPGRHPEVKVNLNSIAAVKDFVNKAMRHDFNMDIASLTTQRLIDAKSIMGIFSLDLSQDIALVAYTTPAEAKAFFDEVAAYVVNA